MTKEKLLRWLHYWTPKSEKWIVPDEEQAYMEIRALIERPKVTLDFIEKQSRIFYVAMLNWKETGVPFCVADALIRIFQEAGIEVEQEKP